MGKVLVHATVSLDGFMADADGGVDWMDGFPVAPGDEELVGSVVQELGAVIGGANKTQTVDDGEVPYGGMAGVPVFLMTHSAHEPIEKDGVVYTFVVDEIAQAVASAKDAAGSTWSASTRRRSPEKSICAIACWRKEREQGSGAVSGLS
ncbi:MULTISPECIES: hypothetical protein [unclassified Microbacterium]|uniref:hypothetical protein n=1 Tax=unclassified Microbacterium TaxID=2609290 RepID=UPI00214CAD97|nr:MULTISPECIES: hypothetical protein [unclassified Microbacterium]MCR2785735.1 hypothetical protein [Microbacterium sp. zg.B96]WIM17281.1 hypothetical protein QNO11_06505 [Microbacterium sp. zg-B96]